jgi:hypothetical protein
MHNQTSEEASSKELERFISEGLWNKKWKWVFHPVDIMSEKTV